MRRGYTLVEMMVVLAVLGVMASASVPALGVWLDREETPAGEVAGLLRAARAEALRHGVPVTVRVDPASGAWRIEGLETGIREGRLILAGEIETPDGEPIVVRIRPTGGVTGGALRVVEGDRAVTVTADRWTGEVSVDQP